tara:strand:+ start:2343 stop:2795 length:453 start_codon:yes stop_codon:yes gene_type:complete
MDAVLSGLEYWHWFALAVTLVIFDVATGATFIFLWCGAAAALVGVILLVLPNMTWEYQLMIFGLGAMSSLLMWFFYLKKRPQTSDQPNLNMRSRQYIGRTFNLIEPIENGRGKVRVGDTLWRVQGADLPIGNKVTVIDVDGVILVVKKAE